MQGCMCVFKGLLVWVCTEEWTRVTVKLRISDDQTWEKARGCLCYYCYYFPKSGFNIVDCVYVGMLVCECLLPKLKREP